MPQKNRRITSGVCSRYQGITSSVCFNSIGRSIAATNSEIVVIRGLGQFKIGDMDFSIYRYLPRLINDTESCYSFWCICNFASSIFVCTQLLYNHENKNMWPQLYLHNHHSAGTKLTFTMTWIWITILFLVHKQILLPVPHNCNCCYLLSSPKMELRCMRMQSPTFSSIPRSVLLDKPLLSSIVNLSRTCPHVTRLKFLHFGLQASAGSARIKSQAQDGSKKDGNLVFVAGATGKVGSRTVRELLKLGFKVRAGVRSIQRAGPLVQSVQDMKLDDVTGGIQATDKFEVVECDLEKPGKIKPALGNASAVICCIGASEKEVFDITGPYRIDFQATNNLIVAATSAKVEYFILLTSLGTNKFGFPAAILNLFWGVLCWKRKAEEAVLASNLPYAIVRPGGMERPTDSYKETHNITLSKEDTLFGGQVSNLQVAELIAFMTKNRSLSCCKVVEVIAETTAPLTPLGELLKKIPSQREDICNFKESDDADRSQPVVLESTSKEKEPKQTSPIKATPLSPYAAYEDLKPPTSPTPTPSSGSTSSVKVNSSKTPTVSVENVAPQIAPKKMNPSSPFINYEDLKPPSSPTPTPTPSGSKAESSTAPTTAELTDVATVESSDATIDSSTPLASNLSPYITYDDLKPPSSPSPSVPELSGPQKTESGAGRPLSPYTMYEDMKPPSSPMPCLRN